jgi:hypothetical protein
MLLCHLWWKYKSLKSFPTLNRCLLLLCRLWVWISMCTINMNYLKFAFLWMRCSRMWDYKLLNSRIIYIFFWTSHCKDYLWPWFLFHQMHLTFLNTIFAVLDLLSIVTCLFLNDQFSDLVFYNSIFIFSCDLSSFRCSTSNLSINIVF